MIEECGAMPDLEDKEGEVRISFQVKITDLPTRDRPRYTKLPSKDILKSSNTFYQTRQMFTPRTLMDGPLSTMLAPRYLLLQLPFLHSYCDSKGYLDVVRWLCEIGGAATELDGIRGVDMRSKGGWTPLSENQCSCLSS